MPIINQNTKPADPPISDVERSYLIRQSAESMRNRLKAILGEMKSIAQDGNGVNALAAQLNSENAGDAAELQTIYAEGKALLASLDTAAASDLGDLT